jgi:hypothetical protein
MIQLAVEIGVSSVSSDSSCMIYPYRDEKISRVFGTKTISRSIFPVALWCLPCEIFHEKYGTKSMEWQIQPTVSLSVLLGENDW